MTFLFWLIIAVNLITFLGYPVFVWGLSKLFGKKSAEFSGPSFDGSVTAIVCAYNEEKFIGAKLLSMLAQDSRATFEIIVADDGSSDATKTIVQEIIDTHPGHDITLLALDRVGKANALNTAVKLAKGDILVHTDADPIWLPDTLSQLIIPFADPNVGVVAGEVVVSKDDDGTYASGEGGFRQYESAIRDAETSLFGCISADGGVYAIRKAHMDVVPLGVTDDFYISTGAVLRGGRIIFAPEARAIEHSIPTSRGQLRRRIRITIRGLTGMWKRRALFNPFKFGLYSVGLFFHKLMRRLAPALLMLLFPVSIYLAPTAPIYLLALLGQLVGYGIALIPFATDRAMPKLLLIPHYILLHLLGLSVGFVLFTFGKRYTQWTPQK